MRKLKKICDLSTAYKAWEEAFEQEGKKHDKYSSSHKYYKDIVMQSLRCQDGLCAYTEQRLCDKKLLTEDCWKDGRYINQKIKVKGNLDHFDEGLKSKNSEKKRGRKDWLWNNFFTIDADVNGWKGTKKVDTILKPDSVSYNPFALFDYEVSTHRFVAKHTWDETTKERINRMIDEVLHINSIDFMRKDYFKKLFLPLRWKQTTEWPIPTQYPTAYEFIRRKIEDGNVDLKAVTF